MREIKFRAWDEHGQSFKPVSCIFFNTLGWYPSAVELDGGEIPEHQHCSTYRLGQYTGLKDKNGREIFEGDIVRDLNNASSEVMWLEEAPGFIFFNRVTDDWWAPNVDAMRDYEIIGNIYENPELLEEK